MLIAELPAGDDTQQALPSSAIIRKNARREPEHQVRVPWYMCYLPSGERVLMGGPVVGFSASSRAFRDIPVRGLPAATMVYMGMPCLMRADPHLWTFSCHDKPSNMVAA